MGWRIRLLLGQVMMVLSHFVYVVSKMLGNSDPPLLYCHDVKSEGNQIMAIVVRNKTLQRNVRKLANFHWGKWAMVRKDRRIRSI